MDLAGLHEELHELIGIPVYCSEPLSRHTTWRIGGPADLLIRPESLEKCAGVLQWAHSRGLMITFLGGGSNVLVADTGIRGLVIQTRGLKSMAWEGGRVAAGVGISLPYLCQEALRRNREGLEFAAGIPGSLGGAVLMNAGAHGSSMGHLIHEVTTLTREGSLKKYRGQDLVFSYRHSPFKENNELLVEVVLNLNPGDPREIKSKMDHFKELRISSQPIQYPNAGSVFKNPPGDSAGRLIEKVGAKGWRVGDAQVSLIHANFIVNLGYALAQDVIRLIKEVREAVYHEYSIMLETEIIYLGFDDTGR